MIELINLTKYYPTPKGRHYVFRDLNFVFPDGVSIGLLGRNGAGKSTLMRIMGGLDTPDSGEVRTNNTISWPVGLSSGFQGSLSARDNVRFVCRVYGATGKAMQDKIDFVQDFADIGKFFDMPMKTLSSGMKGRVTFGLSMAFDFDYYLVDEGMSAGDPAFAKKAKDTFRDKISTANLIMVSHNVRHVQDLCDVVVVLDRGQVTLYEDVAEGLAVYQNMKSPQSATTP